MHVIGSLLPTFQGKLELSGSDNKHHCATKVSLFRIADSW